jgi:hypothetical protein
MRILLCLDYSSTPSQCRAGLVLADVASVSLSLRSTWQPTDTASCGRSNFENDVAAENQADGAGRRATCIFG